MKPWNIAVLRGRVAMRSRIWAHGGPAGATWYRVADGEHVPAIGARVDDELAVEWTTRGGTPRRSRLEVIPLKRSLGDDGELGLPCDRPRDHRGPKDSDTADRRWSDA